MMAFVARPNESVEVLGTGWMGVARMHREKIVDAGMRRCDEAMAHPDLYGYGTTARWIDETLAIEESR